MRRLAGFTVLSLSVALAAATPQSGRSRSQPDSFDPAFFNSGGFGDYARQDLAERGGFQDFENPPEARLISRRRDDSVEDVRYADPADLWQGEIPGLAYGRREQEQQQPPRYDEREDYRRQRPQQRERSPQQQQQQQQRERQQYDERYRPSYDYSRPDPEPERPQYRDDGYGGYEPQRSRRRPQQDDVDGRQNRRTLKVKQQRPQPEMESRSGQAEEEDVERASPAAGAADFYRPASGPAYATATNVDELNRRQFDIGAAPHFDAIPYPAHHAEGTPADQRSLEHAVIDGANAYKPDGVYQNEDRLEFQIHGHQGPHSYRYGYDTGHGYNRQFRYEERGKDGHVKGRYGFFDRYGKLQIVNYSADPYKGFHAEGAHVPHYPH